ncbi:MerR family transcriptional regulator [Bdellovibrio sp. SKB1291214]|uniref:MerR family transcriptional regulator n=1 Tax=Bdellovibrio sp. SKB1291214 TaxID=1732569 RepID=UPI0020CD84A8|nr:MerR family transcriptional regulator [Bdellovibrio sp. SKB1291214]UYL08381.1 MerR family transcriptional regulator [Bdellovibrio sp. SKB1291214]
MMMTTTATMNSAEVTDTATASTSERTEYPMTPIVDQSVDENQLSFEDSLALGDQHLEFIEAESAGVPQEAVQAQQISIPAMLCDDKLMDEIKAIPNKMAFKIGDVAEILGIKQYVLRYWETEFDVLKPKKASNNQRMYTRKDVENALLIRKLLHRDRFSIEGARNAMKELKAHVRKEKDMSQVYHKLDNVNEMVEGLLTDIRKLRGMFM